MYNVSSQKHNNMKTKGTIFGALLVIAVAMTSCFGLQDEPTFVEADLVGLWGEGSANYSDTIPVHFVRFTAEQDATGEYECARIYGNH
jgi:hypothetical protein